MVKRAMVVPRAKLRADAQANRECILEAAREAFAADPNASLNAIGKAAGVGAGTLYRHFPNREALLVGVYRKEIDALVDLAPVLVAEMQPLRAFQCWCEQFARFGEVKHGVANTLQAAISQQDLRETYLLMVEVVGRFLHACEAAGDTRPDARPEDVLALLSTLLRIPPTPEGRAQVVRLLDVIMRGLTSKPSAPPFS